MNVVRDPQPLRFIFCMCCGDKIYRQLKHQRSCTAPRCLAFKDKMTRRERRLKMQPTNKETK